MSTIDILRAEKARREESKAKMLLAQEANVEAVRQLKEADNLHSGNLAIERAKLEGAYLERRHYTGDWPIVYSEAETTKYPYYNGPNNTDCNPYFRMTAITAGDIGIDPIDSPPDRDEGGDGTLNGVNRLRAFSASEDVVRVPALSALNTFVAETTLNPDTTNNAPGEPLPDNWPEEEIDPDPVWNGPDTATGKLRPILTAWRDDLVIIRDDIYLDDTASVDFYQDIIDDCNTVLAAVADDAVFVRNTGVEDASTWGQTQPLVGADLTALNNIIAAADTGVVNFTETRDTSLQGISDSAEKLYFGIVKLRLHVVNGSFSKLKGIESSQVASKSIVKDHDEAIQSLTELIAAQL